MPSAETSTAFEARLNSWPNIAACPLVDLNTVSEVPKPPFIELEYPVSVEDRITTGRPAIFRERGGIRFVITVAALQDGWKAQVLGWAGEIYDLFLGEPFPDGLEVISVSRPVLDGRNSDGNRYRVPFVATYTSDVLK